MIDTLRTDDDVIAALRAGDEGAFRALVTTHHATMIRVASAFVPTRAIAEEVVQDTWLAVIDGLARFEGRSALKTWLYAILVNTARARGKREHRTVPFASTRACDDDSSPTVDPERFLTEGRWIGHWSQPPSAWDTTGGRLEADETRRVVEVAIAALPGNQQRVVWLRDVEGWTSDEVCAALDLSEANQRVLLHRGRAKVRAALEQHLAD